jgi:hypothetical protein
MRIANLGRAALAPVVLLASLALRPGPSITILRDEAVAHYPETIEFHLAATSSADVVEVELSFQTNALACGDAVTRAYPEDFIPSTDVDVEWTWNLRQAGSLPPGTTVTWHWALRDSTGAETLTPAQSLTFTNANMDWRRESSASIDLFLTEGDAQFAGSLLAAGEAALVDLKEMTGVQLAQRVQAYVFPTSEEMQANTLFAPDWSGGLAFPAHRTVLLAVGPGDTAWGEQVIAHELAHVVIGAYTFSCFAGLPTWLDEGLALVAEGRQEPFAGSLLEEAIRDDTLLSVRSLGLGFSADPDLALLAYSESESLVLFLTEAHGQESMLHLLDEFRSGASEDRALREVYGFDRDGLEAAWRAHIGARPMETAADGAGSEPTRTPYPTLAPITGPLPAATPLPLSASPNPSSQASEVRSGAPGSLLAIVILAGACVLGPAAVALTVVLIRRSRPGRS